MQPGNLKISRKKESSLENLYKILYGDGEQNDNMLQFCGDLK